MTRPTRRAPTALVRSIVPAQTLLCGLLALCAALTFGAEKASGQAATLRFQAQTVPDRDPGDADARDELEVVVTIQRTSAEPFELGTSQLIATFDEAALAFVGEATFLNFSGSPSGAAYTYAPTSVTNSGGGREVQINIALSSTGTGQAVPASETPVVGFYFKIVDAAAPKRLAWNPGVTEVFLQDNVTEVKALAYEGLALGQTLQAPEGWRLLGAPATTTFAALLGPVWTQGAPGTDAPDGPPTVFAYDETEAGGADVGFEAVTSAFGSAMPLGRGYAVYVFADNSPAGTFEAAFPAALAVDGAHPALPFDYALSYTDTVTPSADGWNLLANPFAQTLDWDFMQRAGLANTVYVWDPATSAYRTWNGSAGTLAGGRIAPMQGFFVQATAPTAALRADRDSFFGQGTFYRAKPTAEMELPTLRLVLRAGTEAGGTEPGEVAATAFVQLRPDAAPGYDAHDAVALSPLSTAYALLATGTADEADDVLLTTNVLAPSASTIRLPLHVLALGAPAASTYSLGLESRSGLTGWHIVLHDAAEDVYLDVENAVVEVEPSTEAGDRAGRSARDVGQPVGGRLRAKRGEPTRYTLVLTPPNVGTRIDEAEGAGALTMDAVYPNPASGSVRLHYTLGQAGVVDLGVFDLLGRRVLGLSEGHRARGPHTAQVDVGALPAGVYIVSVQAGGAGRADARLVVAR